MEEAPGTWQTIFFSATFPDTIKLMVKKYMHSPKKVVITESTEERPKSPEDYTHRIRRTGRAGKTGFAVTPRVGGPQKTIAFPSESVLSWLVNRIMKFAPQALFSRV